MPLACQIQAESGSLMSNQEDLESRLTWNASILLTTGRLLRGDKQPGCSDVPHSNQAEEWQRELQDIEKRRAQLEGSPAGKVYVQVFDWFNVVPST